jgi:hypothetical protein
MRKDKIDEIANHNQTKDEKSLPAETSLTREGSKAPSTTAPDEGVISARKKAYGTTDLDFLKGLVKQIAYAGRDRADYKVDRDYKLSVIRGAEPRHQFESMLALQMEALHGAVMKCADNLAHAENVLQQDSAGRLLNKLSGTYLDLLNYWERNRTGGDQKVMVQHVSVNDGGQAIVGAVTQAPRANVADTPAAASPPTLAKTQTDPMAIVEKNRERVAVLRRRPKLNDR